MGRKNLLSKFVLIIGMLPVIGLGGDEMLVNDVLNKALDDEYKNEAFYQAVMQRFGEQRPFSNLLRAEKRHAEAIIGLIESFGFSVPQNQYLGKVELPETLALATQQAIASEHQNIVMYDHLLEMVDDNSIVRVFTNLRRASKENHLAALQRFLERRR